MKKINVLLLAFLLLSFWANAQQYPFNGLDMNMGKFYGGERERSDG